MLRKIAEDITQAVISLDFPNPFMMKNVQFSMHIIPPFRRLQMQINALEVRQNC